MNKTQHCKRKRVRATKNEITNYEWKTCLFWKAFSLTNSHLPRSCFFLLRCKVAHSKKCVHSTPFILCWNSILCCQVDALPQIPSVQRLSQSKQSIFFINYVILFFILFMYTAFFTSIETPQTTKITYLFFVDGVDLQKIGILITSKILIFQAEKILWIAKIFFYNYMKNLVCIAEVYKKSFEEWKIRIFVFLLFYPFFSCKKLIKIGFLYK